MGICIIIKNINETQNFIKKKKCLIHSIIFLPRSKFVITVRVKLSKGLGKPVKHSVKHFIKMLVDI